MGRASRLLQSHDWRKGEKLGGRMVLPPDPKSPLFILGYLLTSN
jgi:hypothetical protein